MPRRLTSKQISLENTLVIKLRAAGLVVRHQLERVSSSRIVTNGLTVALMGRDFKVSLKARSDFRNLHAWLHGKDGLVLQASDKPTLVVLRLDDLLSFAKGSANE